jgi:hypothetical protein
MRATLILHILAGSLGLLSGALALYSAKGQPLHRKAGRVFFFVMLTMTTTGALMAAITGTWAVVNIPAALITAYLVVTGFITVRPPRVGARAIATLAMLVALGVGLVQLTFGFQAIAGGGSREGIPAFPFFLFGIVGTLAGVQDLRLLRAGGVLQGRPRLVRHLWRMCFALFIAAMSFFLGQQDVIPKPIRIPGLLALPVLAILATMLYWLWRYRARRGASQDRPIQDVVEATS